MTLHRKIEVVLQLAQSSIDRVALCSDKFDLQQTLDAVCGFVSDIQTDNEGQYVIYTGYKDPRFEKEEEEEIYPHPFIGPSRVDDCDICGHRYAHNYHHLDPNYEYDGEN